MSKKLEKGSQYEQFDLDGDGIVSDDELARSEHMIRLENSDKMQDQQRMLCWVSSISSIISTGELSALLLNVDLQSIILLHSSTENIFCCIICFINIFFLIVL